MQGLKRCVCIDEGASKGSGGNESQRGLADPACEGGQKLASARPRLRLITSEHPSQLKSPLSCPRLCCSLIIELG